MDPMEEAALAQFAGAGGPAAAGPQGPASLPGGPFDEGGGGEVQCQVCRTVIDNQTGAPLQPVDRSAAEAATRFVASEDPLAAEMGGVELGGAPLPPELGGF